jgi:hypothetical protein
MFCGDISLRFGAVGEYTGAFLLLYAAVGAIFG